MWKEYYCCTGVTLRRIEVSPYYVIGKDGDRYVSYRWEGAELAVIRPDAAVVSGITGDLLGRHDISGSNGPLSPARR